MTYFNLNGPTGRYEDERYRDWTAEDYAAENAADRKERALEVCRETAAKLLNIHGVSKEILKSYADYKARENKPDTYKLEDFIALIIHEACEDFTYNDAQNDDYIPETE